MKYADPLPENTESSLVIGKPAIGISLGDFNGIGPEIIIKVLSDARLLRFCTPVVYASLKMMQRWKTILQAQDISFHIRKIGTPINLNRINLVNCWEQDYEPEPGIASAQSGQCAYLSLQSAVEEIKNTTTQMLLTGPICKHNMPPEFAFAGHTDYLESQFAGSKSMMILASETLRVALATVHIPLANVASGITALLLQNKIEQLNTVLQSDFGIKRPKIAVLGLNPHAGEAGKIGMEEQLIIEPAIKYAKNKHVLVWGPFATDGFFGSGEYKKFDAVLALYHDQGLIPFKMLAFETGTNFTGGLPIVRTSPDHGTAFGIAGKNIANEESFRHALFLGLDIINHRKEKNQPQFIKH